MEKCTKKFEINTKCLENFDQMMSVKLDEIQELKITGLDKSSKLLNIVSLCANVKTLILENDPRLNSDKILANIFKPEKLENLVFSHVKLPTEKAMKRFKNLKMISLKEIRFSDLKNFFEAIEKPESVEIIEISNTDMMHQAIGILQIFSKLKGLNLNHIQNGKMDHFEFLEENENMMNIVIKNVQIPVKQCNFLLNAKGSKNICVNFSDLKEGNLKIIEKKSEITFLIEDLKKVSKLVKLNKIENLKLKINKLTNIAEYFPILKHQKSKIQMIIKDFSCLSAKSAIRLKKRLYLKVIQMQREKRIINYDIEHYIKIRQELEKIIQSVENYESQPEKFLGVYQYLGKEYTKEKECTALELCGILQNSLKCLNIESNLVAGKDLENDEQHYWNQVELEGKWYHVDLWLDIENIRKNKAEYCLLSNKKFLETHRPKARKKSLLC